MGESAWYKYSGEIIITNVDMLESGSDLDSEERGGEGTGLDLVRVILLYGNRKLAQNHNYIVSLRLGRSGDEFRICD